MSWVAICGICVLHPVSMCHLLVEAAIGDSVAAKWTALISRSNRAWYPDLPEPNKKHVLSIGMNYQPPYQITPAILSLVEQIDTALDRLQAAGRADSGPQLRRGNRIKAVQASLEIEGNTLSLNQVAAVLEGKQVLAHPRELQEVRNAFAAYDAMAGWLPHAEFDLLAAHSLLMAGLVGQLGRYRAGAVGVHGAQGVVHVAPPAARVPELMAKLLEWLGATDEHPLIASAVFHYEFEFIHPFEDGNGRMGRLWQALILGRWRSVFSDLPVESAVRDHRSGYYAVLNACNQAGESTQFISFMLEMILRTLRSAARTEQETEQETEHVER